jgi:hypothetical protein
VCLSVRQSGSQLKIACLLIVPLAYHIRFHPSIYILVLSSSLYYIVDIRVHDERRSKDWPSSRIISDDVGFTENLLPWHSIDAIVST